MIIHFCRDLMLVAKISSWAKQNDMPYKSIAGLDALEAWLAAEGSAEDSGVCTIAVDLQIQGIAISEMASRLRELLPSYALVGYAQHVMTDTIAQAEQAGFDRVLTRGQFDRQYADLFTESESRS